MHCKIKWLWWISTPIVHCGSKSVAFSCVTEEAIWNILFAWVIVHCYRGTYEFSACLTNLGELLQSVNPLFKKMTNNFKMPFLFNTPIWNQVLIKFWDFRLTWTKYWTFKAACISVKWGMCFARQRVNVLILSSRARVPALLLHLIGEYNQTFLVCKPQLNILTDPKHKQQIELWMITII